MLLKVTVMFKFGRALVHLVHQIQVKTSKHFVSKHCVKMFVQSKLLTNHKSNQLLLFHEVIKVDVNKAESTILNLNALRFFFVLFVLLFRFVFCCCFLFNLDSFSKQISNSLVIFRHKSVFVTTALLNLPIHSIFLCPLLPDFIGSLVRLLQPKPRYDPSAFLKNIFFALEGSKRFILIH